MLDNASEEFVAMKLEIEGYKAANSEHVGRLLVIEEENKTLRSEIDTLRQALEATQVKPTDDAKLVPVDGATVLVVPDTVIVEPTT